jgi:hypothetical protein
MGMVAMAGVGAPWPAMRSSPKRGKRGRRRREGGAARGGMGAARGCHGEGLQALLPTHATSCT